MIPPTLPVCCTAASHASPPVAFSDPEHQNSWYCPPAAPCNAEDVAKDHTCMPSCGNRNTTLPVPQRKTVDVEAIDCTRAARMQSRCWLSLPGPTTVSPRASDRKGPEAEHRLGIQQDVMCHVVHVSSQYSAIRPISTHATERSSRKRYAALSGSCKACG